MSRFLAEAVGVSVQVIAVIDERDAEPLEAMLLKTVRRRSYLIGWWGGYASESMSASVRPKDVLRWEGWRPVAMALPKDWEEGYLRSINGEIEFVYGKPPANPARKA
jgi:hypothetical protein